MFHVTRPGWIEVIAGVMFSGKSEELIRRVKRDESCRVWLLNTGARHSKT